MHQLHQFIEWIVQVVGHWGYPGIFVLMCLESTVVPVPSELVLPPAGYLASQGQMNIFVAVLMGTLGSMAGASINYGAAVWLGRPFLLRYGKYFLCPPHKFEKVEQFFLRHGEIGTFTGRLILGIRHFISLPAGLARMKMSRFLFYTALGSAIWCGVLAALGFWIGRVSAGKTAEEMNELFQRHGKTAGVGATLLCVAIIAVYVYVHRRKQASDA
jgi:membrane protein DedA with SNARE-associated domain